MSHIKDTLKELGATIMLVSECQGLKEWDKQELLARLYILAKAVNDLDEALIALHQVTKEE